MTYRDLAEHTKVTRSTTQMMHVCASNRDASAAPCCPTDATRAIQAVLAATALHDHVAQHIAPDDPAVARSHIRASLVATREGPHSKQISRRLLALLARWAIRPEVRGNQAHVLCPPDLKGTM